MEKGRYKKNVQLKAFLQTTHPVASIQIITTPQRLPSLPLLGINCPLPTKIASLLISSSIMNWSHLFLNFVYRKNLSVCVLWSDFFHSAFYEINPYHCMKTVHHHCYVCVCIYTYLYIKCINR